MRKVFYSIYIHAKHEESGKVIEGTGCFSEPKNGFFHQWGFEGLEGSDGNFAMTSVAIIEDATTGNIHQVIPEKTRFVQPPQEVSYVEMCTGLPGKPCINGRTADTLPCQKCKGSSLQSKDVIGSVIFPTL